MGNASLTETVRRTKIQRWGLVAFGLVMLLGLSLRLVYITRPPIDFLSWRDSQTLMVARNFYREGMNLFSPSVDWRTTREVVPKGTVGITELMVVPYLTAILYHLFGIQWWVGRVVPIFFALIGTVYYFRLVERFYGLWCAVISSLLLTVSPYFLYCGRCQMPEPFALAMAFATLYHYDAWVRDRRMSQFSWALLFCTLMLLGKPQFIVTAVPMFYLSAREFGWSLFHHVRPYLFLLIVGLVMAVYFWWSYVVLPVKAGLTFGNAEGFAFRRWLTDPAYYLMISKSVWLWAVTPPVCMLAFLGLMWPRPRPAFAYAWLAGGILFFFLMPGGNAANGYYQVMLAPPAALLAGRLFAGVFEHKRLRIVAGTALIVAVGWSLFEASHLYIPNHSSDYACGTWVRDHTPEDALVLSSSPSPATLYFADRVGWTPWTEGYGRGASFNHDFVNKVLPLGASVLAVPLMSDFFDNSYYKEYQGIRDDLYDTYSCYKDPEFTIFLLREPANLQVSVPSHITFGTLDSRKHLRGNWGPNQINAQGSPFATMGPGHTANIVFAGSATPRRIMLDIASPVAGQDISITLNREKGNVLSLPTAGERGTVEILVQDPSAISGKCTITLEATKQNRDGVSLILYGISFD